VSRPFVGPPPQGPVEPRGRPTFSIAIAAYQAAGMIGAALDSALAQTLQPLEIAVCDDGSTDDLETALAPYRERIVVVRHEHNRGLAAAKNSAASATSAEFVAFLDADDLYYPERLEALAELAAARPDLDVLTTNADLELDGERTGRYYPDIARFPASDQPLGIIASDSAIFGAAAVRRSVFEASGGLSEELRSSDDWELWLRLSLSGSLFGLVDEPLYLYRVHERGASADQVGGSRDAVRVLERVLDVTNPGRREREALESGLAELRRTAALVEAELALRSRDPRRRRLSLSVATGNAFSPQTRVKSLFAAAFPGTAARLLERRERRSGVSKLRKPMPRRQ
jgi:glycosyltransferase involved in cell wall biosynthesis